MKNYYYVYKITNKLNGMIYIGCRASIKLPNEDNYMGSGTLIKAAIKLYGKNNFKKEILATFKSSESSDEEAAKQAYAYQKQLVNTQFVGRQDTYNKYIATGVVCALGNKHTEQTKKKISYGNKGRMHSEQTKKKISQTKKGKPKSEQTRRRMSQGHKGKPMSEQTKIKISQSHKGKKLGPMSEQTKKKISQTKKGKKLGPMSEQTKIKISQSRTGQKIGPFSKQTRQKMSSSQKGRRHSEQTKHKISQTKRKIREEKYIAQCKNN